MPGNSKDNDKSNEKEQSCCNHEHDREHNHATDHKHNHEHGDCKHDHNHELKHHDHPHENECKHGNEHGCCNHEHQEEHIHAMDHKHGQEHGCCDHGNDENHVQIHTADRNSHEHGCCQHEHDHHHEHEHDHHHMQKGDHRHAHHHGEACCSVHSGQTVSRSLLLEGMHCGDCAAKLEKSVSRMNGVSHVEVNFATAKMSIGYNETVLSYESIKKQIQNLGYNINDQTEINQTKSIFRIEGMDCADCAQKLEKRVGALAAVSQVMVNFGAAKMTVAHDGTAADDVIKTVRQAGYTAHLEEENSPRQTEERSFWRRNNKVLPTSISGALFVITWGLSYIGLIPESASNVLYALAIIIGGYRIAKTGLYGLKSWTIGMDLLMTVAAVGAAIIGQWEEGAAVVFLFSLGETLEAYTMDRTRKSIRSLMDLSPKEALIRRNGVESVLPIEKIQIGDTLIIKPGEKIAMDGNIVKGTSTINQAPITGESIPVEKAEGDEVFAGTINQFGSLEVKVTKLSKDNTLSRIVHMVEEAQAQKAPSQRFVDVFAKYYTPAVIIIALGIAIVPPVFMNQPFDTWFYRALMMLVVSCPCALVISTPVSIVSAIGNAARNGVLIKGGAHLERLGVVSVVAFDKTGTLTSGIPQVTKVIPLDQRDEQEVLAIAAAIESRSEHPVAEAIVRKAKLENVQIHESTNFTSITGKGVRAAIGGIDFYVGSPRWFLHDLNISLVGLKNDIQRLEAQGQTVMVLGTKENAWAAIAVADEVRVNSKETLDQLHQIGIRKAVMLTGDNRGTAEAVAAKLGDIGYRAELLPQDKVTSIKELMSNGDGVAMIGDGVNDAPALATATVGIAMGAAGTDTALETADVALMADDLSKLPYAIELSRRSVKIIKQNIAFSLLVKVVFLSMIFFGISTLWMAVLADTGSSLIVIANGMRLLRSTRPNMKKSNMTNPMKIPAN